MKWTTATALFLAVAAGGVGVTAVINREPRKPADILADVERDMSGNAFDREGAIKELSRAIDDDRLEGNPEVEVRLRRMRADIYRELGQFRSARADLEVRVEGQAPMSRETKLEIVELLTLEGGSDAALPAIRRLVQNEPDFGEAKALQARLLVGEARAGLREAYATAAQHVATREAARAEALIAELASRVPEDPQRGALTTKLSETLSAGGNLAMSEIIEQINQPRTDFKNARKDYAAALELISQPAIIVALGELLERAGQLELSVKLHRASRNLPEVARDPEAMAAYLSQLMKSNRTPEAVTALQSWDYADGGSLEFYRSAGEVFYRSGEYRALGPVAAGLIATGGDIGRDWGTFFSRVANISTHQIWKKQGSVGRTPAEREARAKQLNDAINELTGFAGDEAVLEPFFGARDAAQFWVADGLSLRGDTIGERSRLASALTKAANPSADDWVRLARLYKQSKELIPWKDIENALSEAMNIDPSRTAELSTEWYQAGMAQIEARGETVDDLVARLSRSGFNSLNSDYIGPSALTLIAGRELALGDYFKARRAAEAARKDFRNLVPPLDILIRVKLASKLARAPKAEIIERIEAAGIDEEVEKFMAQLDGGRLDGAELVRAIRAAPERFGKAAVARYYLSLDDAARAGDALVGIKDATAPPELKLLRGRLLVAGERFKRALEELVGLERDPLLRGETLLLRMESLIGLNRIDQLDGVATQVRNLAAANPREKPVVLESKLTAVDMLASCGRVDLALVSLEALDQRPETRTPAFYRRKLLVDALTLEEQGPVATQETILRAEPYLNDGTAEMMGIALAVSQRDWTELPLLVDRLLDSGYKPGPKQEAALELLGERLQSGARATESGLAASPRDAEWAFLSCVAASLVDGRLVLPQWFGPTATRDAARLLRGNSSREIKDPRDALVVYLMSSRPEWSPWVLPRILELQQASQSTLWTNWLRARVQASIGQESASARSIARLIELHPLFGPGHDTAVALAKRAHPTEPLHPQIVRARRIRLQSLGEELIANPIEIRLARAGEFARRNENTKAIQELQPVVNSGGIDAAEGRLILGLLMIRLEQYSVAALQLESALKQDAGIFEETVIGSLLFALGKAIDNARSETPAPQRSPLSVEAALTMLGSLKEKFPLDPMIALAELELDGEENNEGDRVILAVRAETTLKRLFITSNRKPLDQLRRGCTRPWIKFLLPISPGLAEEILARDLVLEPGNLDVWQLSGEVAEAQGQFEEARGYYEALLKIDPRPDTMFSLAEIMIREGEEPNVTRALLRQASTKYGGGSEKVTYLKTVADLQDRRLDKAGKYDPQLDEIVPRLRAQWSSRQRIAKEVDTTDLGLLYADALFRRLAAIESRARAAAAAALKALNDDKPENDPDPAQRAEEVAESDASYRATLTELRAFLPELKAHIESDLEAYYELDLATALGGIAGHIATKGFKAPL